jgi:hypothetical protein
MPNALTALDAFGFASVGLTPSDFERPDQVVQLGVPPVRIDLLTSITGVSWDEAWAGRVTGRYRDIVARSRYFGSSHDSALQGRQGPHASETLRSACNRCAWDGR